MKKSMAEQVNEQRTREARDQELKLEEAAAESRARTNGPIPRTGDAARHGRRPLVVPGATAATPDAAAAAWAQRPGGW